MSVTTSVIVEGAAVRVSSREITVKNGPNAGNKITLTSLLIVGQDCMAEVRVNTEQFSLPKMGDTVKARCLVSTYRDDDELSLDAWL